MGNVTLGLVGYGQAVELKVDDDELVEITVNSKAVAAIDARPEETAASIGTWEDVEGQEHYRRCIHIGKALGVPDGLEGPADEGGSVNVNDIDYRKLSTQDLEALRGGAQAELYGRVHHYAGDSCEVLDAGDVVWADGVRTTAEELSEGDVYDLDDGEFWRVDDIRPVPSGALFRYHVTRTRVDE